MTADDIREYLDWYEKNFEYIFTRHEGYKWHAIKVFQDKIRNHEDELAEKLDMSYRTIYRYIDTFMESGFAVVKLYGNVYKLGKLPKKAAEFEM